MTAPERASGAQPEHETPADRREEWGGDEPQQQRGYMITLFGPGNQARDSFAYAASTEGRRIDTEH